MCVCVGVCGSQKELDFPVAGVTGGYKSPYMGARK